MGKISVHILLDIGKMKFNGLFGNAKGLADNYIIVECNYACILSWEIVMFKSL